MLSRVASNVYWMGRYLERAEHMARYTKVQYFTIFDAPSLQDKDFALRSIINMTGIAYDQSQEVFDEQEILLKVGLDRSTGASILSNIFMARENARSARNVLSDELWEYINSCYHFTNNYDPQYFKTRGLYEFTREINDHIYMIKSCLFQTLLHDFKWVIINLGIYLERSVQLTRIVLSKLSDIEILEADGRNEVLIDYQWTTVLKMVEGFDIYNRLIRRHQKHLTPSLFILKDSTFPRSILYNLEHLHQLVERVGRWEHRQKELEYMSGRLASKIKYHSICDVQDMKKTLSEVLSELYAIHAEIDRRLFHNTEE